MKKVILLLLLATSGVFGQVNGVFVTEPVQVVDSSDVKYAVLGYTNNWFFGKKWAYWMSDNEGIPYWGGKSLIGTRSDDSTTTVSNIPLGWSEYTPPCIINDGQFLANWNVSNDLTFELRAEQFGDSLWVTQVLSDVSPHAFVVRGKNFLGNSGAGVESNSFSDSLCLINFAGGDTDLGGLIMPSSFITPNGYTSYYTSDSTLAFTDSEEFNPSQNSFQMTPVVVTTQPNIINLDQFSDITPHPKLKFSFGHGSPLFTSMVTDGQLVPQLKKGWTHTSNAGAYGLDEIPSSAASQWLNPSDDFEGIFGTVGQTPDFANITDQQAKTAGFNWAGGRCCTVNPDVGPTSFTKNLNHLSLIHI